MWSTFCRNRVRSRLGHINYRDFLESYEKSEGSILTDRSTGSSCFQLDLGPVVSTHDKTSNKKVTTKRTQQNVVDKNHYENHMNEHSNEQSTWTDNYHTSEVVSSENWADRTTDLQITGRTYREPYDRVTANQIASNSKKQFTKHAASHNVAFRDPVTNEIVSNSNQVNNFSTNETHRNKHGALSYSTNENASKEKWAVKDPFTNEIVAKENRVNNFSTNETRSNKNAAVSYSTNESASKDKWVTHPSNQVVSVENWEKTNTRELTVPNQKLTEQESKHKTVSTKSIGSFPMTQTQLDNHITTQILETRKTSGKTFDIKAKKLENNRSQLFTPPSD